MKNLFTLLSLLLCCSTINNLSAQKKWVVEYNKLADSFSYYEVLTTKGKETEKPLSKAPAVYNGDVVKFRCINLNEYVFSVKIDNTNGELIKEESSSGLAGALVSMFNPLGFAGNFGRTIDLMDNMPSVNGMTVRTRGNSAAMQLQKEIVDVKDELGQLIEFAAVAEAPTALLYAEDLTVEEMREKFQQACSQVDVSLFSQRKNEFEQHFGEVIAHNEALEVAEADLGEAIAEISAVYEEFDQAYTGKHSPIDYERIKKDLGKRTFSVERSIVVNNSNMGSDHYGTSTNIFWNIEFSADRRPKASSFGDEDQESQGSYGSDSYFTSANANTLRSNVIAQLPIRGAIMPKLSTGLMGVLPFGGFASYSFTKIPDEFGYNDSLIISKSMSKSPQLVVGTMVNFAISTKRNIIPSFGFGASYALAKGSESALGILVGGHLGLKSFPFLSLSYGVNFRQTKVLKSEYQLDAPIIEPESDYYSGEYNIFDYVFKPGMFLGLSMQF
jgi:hypothetical protein